MSGVRRFLSSLVVSAAALCLLCAPGLANGGDETADKSRQIRLHGLVTRPDGTPAAHCPVHFRLYGQLYGAPDSRFQVTTGPDGRYSASVEAAERVVVEAWVYGIGQSKLLSAVAPIGEESVRLDIPLKPIPTMSGRVFLPGGAPAADLSVEGFGTIERSLEPVYHMGMASGGGGILALQTDSAGHYRTPLFPPSPPESPPGHGAQYYVYLVSSAGWAPLLAAEVDLDRPEIHQDIQLRHGDRVEGVVLGYPGAKPLGTVSVEAGISIGWMRQLCRIGEAKSDASGRFEIPVVLPPGEYKLGARAKDWLLVSVEEEQRVDAGAGSRIQTRIAMARPLRIEGTIYGSDGAPLRNARVVLRAQATTPDPDGGAPLDGPRWGHEITTDGEGRYAYEYEPWFRHGGPPTMPRYVRIGPVVPGAATCEPVLLDVFEEQPAEVDFHFRAGGGDR